MTKFRKGCFINYPDFALPAARVVSPSRLGEFYTTIVGPSRLRNS